MTRETKARKPAKASATKPKASGKSTSAAKTQLLEAGDVDAYLASLPEDRKADVQQLHALFLGVIKPLRPKEQVRLWGSASARFIGYGLRPYKYASGREGTWFPVGIANQKQYISVYICAVNAKGQYLAEAAKAKLPKASVGKSCIRIKRLADVDVQVLAALAREALESPLFMM